MTLSMPAIILDLILLFVLAFTAFSYTRKGFAAGIVKLVGNLTSLVVSILTASKLAPILFDRFFREGLITRTQQAIEQQGVPYLSAFVEDVASFLPIEFVQNVLEQASKVLNEQSANLAHELVELTFKPLFVPLISVIIFFVIYAVLRIVISQLSAALINVNKIPLIGGINRVLGLVTGVLCGVLEVIVVLCAIWALITLTNNEIPYVNTIELSNSMFYSVFNNINPFLKF